MGLKFFLNVLYNLGIILSLFTLYWALQHHQYGYLVMAIIVLVLFVILKLRLIKEVKNTLKKP